MAEETSMIHSFISVIIGTGYIWLVINLNFALPWQLRFLGHVELICDSRTMLRSGTFEFSFFLFCGLRVGNSVVIIKVFD